MSVSVIAAENGGANGAPEALSNEIIERQDWPYRPWIITGILALSAAFVYYFIDPVWFSSKPMPSWRAAGGAFFFFGGLALAISLERERFLWSLIFAGATGLVLAGISWWVSGYSNEYDYFVGPFISGVGALIIATPIFQALRDNDTADKWYLSYNRLHLYAWSDVVCGAVSLAFTGLSWLLLLLISQLFVLIGIKFIEDLMNNALFAWVFSGASFGVALGILRENDRILGTLLRIALIILSIMAPFMGAALAIFLISLLFTGLDDLWAATSATTPILMGCTVGAVILANAVIRNNNAETSQSHILQISALILGLAILPLAIIAAISTGLRIDQYGLTPERLWGLLVVIVGVVYGVSYAVTIALKRLKWADMIRTANTRLALFLCAVLVLLALPIFDFGAISARDQIARLNSGEVSEDAFDYFALAHDFGPVGRELAQELAQEQNGQGSEIAKKAQAAIDAEDRWDYDEVSEDALANKEAKNVRLIVQPQSAELPETLKHLIRKHYSCRRERLCHVIMDGSAKAFVVANGCKDCMPEVAAVYVRKKDGINWQDENDSRPRYGGARSGAKESQLSEDSVVEMRIVEKRQIFVDGTAAGPAFD